MDETRSIGEDDRGRDDFGRAALWLTTEVRNPLQEMPFPELSENQYMGPRQMARVLAQLRWLEARRGKPFQSILEAGCGHGHFTRHLLAIAPVVLAFDFSQPAVEDAIEVTKRPDVFRVGDGLDPASITNQRFDLIVLAHFHPLYRPVLGAEATLADYRRFFAGLLRRYQERLTPDGVVYVEFQICDTHWWRPSSGRCSPMDGIAFVAPRPVRFALRCLSRGVYYASRGSYICAAIGKNDEV